MNELIKIIFLLAQNWREVCPSFVFGLAVSSVAVWAVYLNVSDVLDRHYRRRS